MPDTKEIENIKEEEEKELGDKLDEDFEIGNEFKDQLIPLALEYYMEVIDDEGDECDDEECGDDHGHGGHGGHHHDSDDEDEKPKKSKKKGGKK
jgi:nucleosome assembly protein 1-like 1